MDIATVPPSTLPRGCDRGDNRPGPKIAALSCGKPVYLVVLLHGQGADGQSIIDQALNWSHVGLRRAKRMAAIVAFSGAAYDSESLAGEIRSRPLLRWARSSGQIETVSSRRIAEGSRPCASRWASSVGSRVRHQSMNRLISARAGIRSNSRLGKPSTLNAASTSWRLLRR